MLEIDVWDGTNFPETIDQPEGLPMQWKPTGKMTSRRHPELEPEKEDLTEIQPVIVCLQPDCLSIHV